jgi:uncharacterized SAM-binding protein YcdF (DUF218 family)
LTFILAALALLLFVLGAASDLRRFSNAVFLGLFLGLTGIGLAGEIAEQTPGPVLRIVALLFALIPAATAVALVSYLLANGVTMIRKEGRRPGNLLSLLTGLAILAVVALLVLAELTGWRTLAVVTGITVATFAYLSFLFVCFVGYGSFYGRLEVHGALDYVVVLGSGLIDGSRVPPLLASRLDRALAVYRHQVAHGNTPMLIASGGRGHDEKLPEAEAMARYLEQQGIPPHHIQQENLSTTTQENLRNSGEIMASRKPDYRCAVVTNNFHVFRSALLARANHVNGQVLGSPTASYFWPSATLREFAAIVFSYRLANLLACLLLAQQCWVTIWQHGPTLAFHLL